MNLEIQYLKKVDKFFSKNSHILSKEKTNEQIKIITIVTDIDFKGDIYK